MSDLPRSWAATTVGAVSRTIRYGYTASASAEPVGPRMLRITDIQRGQVKWDQVPHCEISAGDAEGYLLEEGDLVFARTGGTVGKSFLIRRVPEPAVFASYLIKVAAADGIVPAFLYWFFQSQSYWEQIGFKKGGLQGNVNATTLSGLELPIPPTREQHRIVAKIEELLSELDKAVESLTLAQAQLKTYRQALLRAAFEGRLTADWRAANPDKLEPPETLLTRIRAEREARYKQALADWQIALAEWRTGGEVGRKPSKPGTLREFRNDLEDIDVTLCDLPMGWAWGRVGFATCSVEYGTAAKSSDAGDVPVIRMGNLQKGVIDWTDLVFTSDEEEIEKYALSPRDILFNRTNSPELVGKTSIYRGERPAIFAGYLVRVNQIESILLAEFVCHFMGTHLAKKHGDSVKTDGVNQSNINGNKLQEYPFPFCSLAEQHRVLEILDAKLSVVDRNLAEIEDHFSRVGALRQSILKKAFSGQLVPQDPIDEPAAALLARLREQAPPARTRRRKTA